MYLFLLFGPILAFVLLVLLLYPSEELGETKHAFLRGVLASVPLWLVARLFGSFVQPLYGSFLLSFHEWADRLLPYSALPGALYLLFYRLSEPLRPGAKTRRVTSFYAGALCPLGLGEMVRVWGHPDAYELFLLPLLIGSVMLAMPRLIAAIEESYGAGRVFVILGSLAATFVASLCPWVFLLRFWPLAWLLALGLGWISWLIARRDLMRRAPVPLAE